MATVFKLTDESFSPSKPEEPHDCFFHSDKNTYRCNKDAVISRSGFIRKQLSSRHGIGQCDFFLITISDHIVSKMIKLINGEVVISKAKSEKGKLEYLLKKLEIKYFSYEEEHQEYFEESNAQTSKSSKLQSETCVDIVLNTKNAIPLQESCHDWPKHRHENLIFLEKFLDPNLAQYKCGN